MNSRYETVVRACVAFMDLVLNCGGEGFVLQNKGNFLYFVAIENSTMDSSMKTMEDGVVDRPLIAMLNL